MLELNSTWPQLVAILIPALGALALAWQLYRIKTSKEEEVLDDPQFVCMVGCRKRPAGSDHFTWCISPWPIPSGPDADSRVVPIELTRSNGVLLADAEKLAEVAKAA